MIPTLLFLLFRKLRRLDWGRLNLNLIPRILIRFSRIFLILVLLLLFFSFVSEAQEQSLSYKVTRNGNEIGWVNLVKLSDNNSTKINLVSEIKTKMLLLSFSAATREVSEFRDGILYHSYYYRKMNGKVKADRHVRLSNDCYEVEGKSEKSKLNISPVVFNTLCMYFREPVDQKQVYSVNHQSFLDIKKEPDGAYRMITPDGTSNLFYYTDGVCTRVKIDHSLYTALLLLK